jgi:hypothetical protein
MIASILLMCMVINTYDFSKEITPSSTPKDRLEIYQRNLPLSRNYNYGIDERPNINDLKNHSITDPLYLIYGGRVFGTNKMEKSYVPKSEMDIIFALMILQKKQKLLQTLESDTVSQYEKIAHLEEYKEFNQDSIAPNIFAGGLNLHGDW